MDELQRILIDEGRKGRWKERKRTERSAPLRRVLPTVLVGGALTAHKAGQVGVPRLCPEKEADHPLRSSREKNAEVSNAR